MSESQSVSRRILVVGIADTQSSLGDHLSNAVDDVTIRTADTAMDGLDALAATELPVCCVVSASDLPDSDGLTLFRRVRERYPELPFVLYPAVGDDALVSDALSAGVTDYVSQRADAAPRRLAHCVTQAVEKRQVEQQLDAERQRCRNVLAASHGETVTVDVDGSIVSTSDRAPDLFGVPDSSLVGRSIDELPWQMLPVDGRPLPESDRLFVEVLETEEPVRDRRIAVERPGGERRYLSVNCVPARADGERSRIVCSFTDITTQRRREEELERSRLRLEELFTYERALDTIGDGIYHLDEDGRFTMVNDVLTELTGYDRTELLGEHASKVLPVDRQQSDTAADAELVADESTEVVTTEFDLETATGEGVPTAVRVTALSENGEFRGTIGIVRDISERKSMEREIHEQNRDIETLLANMPTILFEMDVNGTFVRVRGKGIERQNLEPEFFEGRAVTTVFEGYPVIEANTERALAGEPVHDIVEFEDVVLEMWMEPVVDDGEVIGVVGTAMDVTDREEHEQTLSDLHAVTRDLLGATTTADVASVVFEGANEILDMETVAVLLYDESAEGLVPAEYTANIDRTLGGIPSVWPKDSNAWTAFQQGVLVSRSDLSTDSHALSADGQAAAGSFIPLGEYGVLVVGGTGADALDRRTLDLADTLAATAEAAMARVDRERALQERERELRDAKAFADALVDSLPDAMHAVDEEGQFIRWNDRLLSVTGYTEAELQQRQPIDLVPQAQHARVIKHYERVMAGSQERTEVDLLTSDGDRVPYELTTAPVVRDGTVEGVVGIGRDISVQKEHERTLTALHNVTRDLLRAESNSAIGEHVVTAFEELLDFDGVTVYRFEGSENVLRPIAASDRTRDLLGSVPTFGPGDGITWEVFVEGEARIYDDVRQDSTAYDPNTPFRTGLFIPLADHGVLVAGKLTPNAMSDRTLELAQILAANCETALTRTERERSLRARDRELQSQNASLQQLKEINDKIRKIHHDLVGAETRTEIETIVCERLAAIDRFSFAWIGSLDPVEDAVVPETWDGDERGYLDSVATSLADAEPAAEAARRGEPVIVDGVAAELRSDPWRKEALSREFLSVAAVPLVYDGVTYGVVTVYADTPDAFTEMAQGVLAELGGTVAHALNAVERKHALLAESHVELEFELSTGTTALSELVATLDCHLTVDGMFPQSDGTSIAYVSIEGADVDAVRETADEFVTIDRVRDISTATDDDRLELRLTGESMMATVAEHGGRLVRISFDGGTGRVVVSLPETTDIRSFIAMFMEKYSGAELYARRRRTREDTTESGSNSVFAKLTPRQTEAMQVAYFSGFFEWPRESTGEELAEALDVSPPTFLEHLRRAEAKLVDTVMDSEPTLNPHDA